MIIINNLHEQVEPEDSENQCFDCVYFESHKRIFIRHLNKYVFSGECKLKNHPILSDAKCDNLKEKKEINKGENHER